MEPNLPNPNSDSFENHPQNINYVYNQIEHGLETKLPPQKIKTEKYLLVAVFFFFAVGLIVSLILLVSGINREQKAKSVSAEEVNQYQATIAPR